MCVTVQRSRDRQLCVRRVVVGPLARGHELGQTRIVEEGERMMIRCEGGPTAWRATAFPPPTVIESADGLYVLVDDGPPEDWSYEFVSAPETR
jgi:hypothetical protein